MYRPFLLTAIVLASAGCHVPMPKFQPFVGAGSPRVPPPATNSYGSPDTYYNSSPATGAQSSSPSSGAASGGFAATDGWRTPEEAIGSGVAPTSPRASIGASISRAGLNSPQASADASSTSAETRQAAFHDTETTPKATTSTRSNPLSLNGMQINDATRPREPLQFIPTGDVIEISQLPRAAAAANPGAIRGFAGSSTAQNPTGVSVSTADSTSATANVSSIGASAAKSLSADGWRSKYVPLGGNIATR